MFLKNIKFGKNQKIAIIVTGGFHTENLCEKFKKDNIAYISIMPAFKDCDGYESPYFRLLASKKTLLEQKLDTITVFSLAYYGFLNHIINEIPGGQIERIKDCIRVKVQEIQAKDKVPVIIIRGTKYGISRNETFLKTWDSTKEEEIKVADLATALDATAHTMVATTPAPVAAATAPSLVQAPQKTTLERTHAKESWPLIKMPLTIGIIGILSSVVILFFGGLLYHFGIPMSPEIHVGLSFGIMIPSAIITAYISYKDKASLSSDTVHSKLYKIAALVIPLLCIILVNYIAQSHLLVNQKALVLVDYYDAFSKAAEFFKNNQYLFPQGVEYFYKHIEPPFYPTPLIHYLTRNQIVTQFSAFIFSLCAFLIMKIPILRKLAQKNKGFRIYQTVPIFLFYGTSLNMVDILIYHGAIDYVHGFALGDIFALIGTIVSIVAFVMSSNEQSRVTTPQEPSAPATPQPKNPPMKQDWETSRRDFLKWFGAAIVGTFIKDSIPAQRKQEPAFKKTSETDTAALQKANIPSIQLDSYFGVLHELSTGSWQNADSPYFNPSDMAFNSFYPPIEGRDGAMLGVGFHQNFSLAVHGNPSTYIILDINPVVTEALVPFFGRLMELAETRREFLSLLMSIDLTDNDVKQILERKEDPSVDQRESLLKLLQFIKKRTASNIQERRYKELIVMLNKEILSRSDINPEQREKIIGWIDSFLAPDSLEKHINDARVSFLRFLLDHGKASWERSTWLSSEENYQKVRSYWIQGKFIGVTADIKGPSIPHVAEWLRRRGEEISVLYTSNVEQWILRAEGPKAAQTMYDVLAQLPLRKDAIVLLTHGPAVLVPKVSSYSRRRWLYHYVITNDPYVFSGLVEWPLAAYGLLSPSSPNYFKNILDTLDIFFKSDRFKSDPVSAGRERKAYEYLLQMIEESKKMVQKLTPETFTQWVKEQVPSININTDYFHAVVFILVDSSFIQPSPEETKPLSAIPGENIESSRSSVQEKPEIRILPIDVEEQASPIGSSATALVAVTKGVSEEKQIPAITIPATETFADREIIISNRQAQTVEAFNVTNRKADTVKVVIGIPIDMNKAEVQPTLSTINRGLAKNGFGSREDNKQVITFEIYVNDPAKTAQNQGRAIQNAREGLPVDGRIVLFAPQMEKGPQLAGKAQETYEGEGNITVVPDAYSDYAPEKNIFPDVMVRVALGRNIAFYYTGKDPEGALAIIKYLLSKVADNDLTGVGDLNELLKRLNEIALRIRPIDYKAITDWQRSQEAVATAL